MNRKMIAKTVKSMENNIRHMLDNIVTKEDLESLNWYHDAHELCKVQSEKYNVDFRTFVSIVAVMSPFQKWENNIQSAIDLVSTGDTVYGYKVNRTKALQILDGDLSKLRGVKVERFAYNIEYPENSDQVTLDQWMYRIFLDDHSKIDVAKNDKEFEPIQTEFIRIANDLGYHPVKLQAVLWVAVRRYVAENKVPFNHKLFA